MIFAYVTNQCHRFVVLFLFISSFRWINSIESLTLEGCESIDDSLFNYLVTSSILSSNNSDAITIEDEQDCRLENICDHSSDFDRFSFCYQCSQLFSPTISNKFQLKILNLSGCYRITDRGLK